VIAKWACGLGWGWFWDEVTGLRVGLKVNGDEVYRRLAMQRVSQLIWRLANVKENAKATQLVWQLDR